MLNNSHTHAAKYYGVGGRRLVDMQNANSGPLKHTEMVYVTRTYDDHRVAI